MTKTKSVRWRKHTKTDKSSLYVTGATSNMKFIQCICKPLLVLYLVVNSAEARIRVRASFCCVFYCTTFTRFNLHLILFFFFGILSSSNKRSPRYRTSTSCTIATSVKTSTSLLKLRWMKMIQTDTQSCYTMVVPKGCMACYQKSSKVTLLTVPSTSCLHHPVDPVYKIEMKVLR